MKKGRLIISLIAISLISVALLTVSYSMSRHNAPDNSEKNHDYFGQTNQEPTTMNNSEASSQPNQKPSIMSDAKGTSLPNQKTVNFSTFEVNKKYFVDAKGFVELKLKLPRLEGNYDGIPEINKYFVGKEKFFYDQLPFNYLKELNRKVEGEKSGWYRSADYKLETVWGDIISISAYLDGGAGGVGWTGIEGDTFNLNTGKKLSLNDIFKVSEDEYMNFIYDFVSKKIMDEINNDKESRHGYFWGDAYSGHNYKNIRKFDQNDFYLSKNGLVVFYQKYVLACGAAGPLKFEIPYESISNMLAINVKNNINY